ncbi:hypothetical protein FB45DRAFT_937813 [Roridomyces roridus]|uniref:F-box domain-containing protein n=1 Tax=Roridomyces roridus TaxID=1738132 RepID=A0AAD7FDN1_9AGAR|nr:hypothetical protein FB45DRAFT_937813 [Roridomyces roridus]
MSSLASPSSPTDGLPDDVLEEIFLACLPTPTNDCEMNACEAPLLLGRICREWRTVSLSAPRLWTSLRIAEPHPPPITIADLNLRGLADYIPPASHSEKLARMADAVKAWLGRSGQCPLSLTFESEPLFDGSGASATSPLLDTLLLFASRWQRVSIKAPISVLAQLLLLEAADVPMLREAEVVAKSRGDTFAWNSLKFLHCASLRSFGAFGVGDRYRDLPMPLWDHLFDLRMTGMMPSHALSWVLARYAQLRSFQVVLGGGRGPPDVPPTIVCEHLESLDIQFQARLTLQSTVQIEFARLSLPKLRRLKVHSGGWEVEDDIDYGPIFAAAPAVTSLDVNVGLFTASSFPQFLRGLPPTIEELRINGAPPHSFQKRSKIFDDEALAVLIPSSYESGSQVGCPNLQVFQADASFSDEMLLAFVGSRMASRVPLARVAVCLRDESGDERVDIRELEEVRTFIEAGLLLEVSYYRPEWVDFC